MTPQVPKTRNVSKMTLRDYFAAKALTGLIAMCADPEIMERPDPERTAEWCYRYADALLKERIK